MGAAEDRFCCGRQLPGAAGMELSEQAALRGGSVCSLCCTRDHLFV